MSVHDWLLDSDPAIRWQALRDLGAAPAGDVAAERARVAPEGWGGRVLGLRGGDGQWGGGGAVAGAGGGGGPRGGRRFLPGRGRPRRRASRRRQPAVDGDDAQPRAPARVRGRPRPRA